MNGVNPYYITALPALGELGSMPLLRPAQLLAHVADCPGPRALLEALFLFDDLLQREACLAGEIEEVSPLVLTPQQLRNEDSLPAYLSSDAQDTDQMPEALKVDSLWEACFRHAEVVAQQYGSHFLTDWIGYEVALRNTLASARARLLGLEQSDYLVAKDLADTDEDFTALLNEWTAAPTPLAGLRVLIKGRWDWIAEHDAWFTFSDDELVAYAAKLMLLHQWRRFLETQQKKSAAKETNTASVIFERTS